MKEIEIEEPSQRETHRDRVSGRDPVRQKGKGRESERDRQAQSRVCRGTREDGQVRPTEKMAPTR